MYFPWNWEFGSALSKQMPLEEGTAWMILNPKSWQGQNIQSR
jgi:hypothetical protein